MHRLTAEDLRLSTLARQFPDIRGRDADAVLDLIGRLGPIQSQVPRAPFLAASSRLPGVTYGCVNGLMADHRLLKTSSLRGTVHTTDRAQYPLVDAVARRQRGMQLTSALNLSDPELTAELARAIEAFADDSWQSRTDLVARARDWLEEHAGPASAATLGTTFTDNLIWGHSGLIRRPKDSHWEKRTDVFHRRTRNLLPELPELPFAEALRELVRVHLRAYGPAQRDDLVFFCGASITAVNSAITSLGDEVVRLVGPNGDYFDLAEPPVGGAPPHDVRLLGEFDGLFVGYQGRNRLRFITEQQLPKVWAKVNGLFSPIVLHEGTIVATWKTLTKGSRTDIEVSMLDPHPPLADDLFSEAVAAAERVLDLTVADVRVQRAP